MTVAREPPSASAPDRCGLAAKRVIVGAVGGCAAAAIARSEDASRFAAESVLLGAGAASVVAFTLSEAGDATAPARGLLTALAVGSVALVWTSVHTVHVLRYARLYYSPVSAVAGLLGQ